MMNIEKGNCSGCDSDWSMEGKIQEQNLQISYQDKYEAFSIY